MLVQFQDENVQARLPNEYLSLVVPMEDVNHLPVVNGSKVLSNTSALCDLDVLRGWFCYQVAQPTF